MPKTPLPEKFLERLTEMLGEYQSRQTEKTFVERPATFRVNTLKATRQEVMETLKADNFKFHPVPWYKDAFILQNRTKRELTELPLYIDGKIYLQSLASMVPPLILAPQAGECVLDLTAAPGSKTSQIAALMGAEGELVANDNNKIRFFKLKHNMELLGVADEKDGWSFTLHMAHGAALSKKYAEHFDKILLDAPCSAEARFIEGDTSTYGYWSERKIKEMAFKQRQLLFAAWAMLKPGGTLVYSTCTFAVEENELQISRLLERYKKQVEVEKVSLDGLKSIPALIAWKGKPLHKDVAKTLRIMPTHEIEGFFVAKIRKKKEV